MEKVIEKIQDEIKDLEIALKNTLMSDELRANYRGELSAFRKSIELIEQHREEPFTLQLTLRIKNRSDLLHKTIMI